MAAQVSIAGKSGSVTVEVAKGAKLSDVLVWALRQLELDETIVTKLAPVVNGEDATLDTVVKDGDVVAVAPQHSNG